MSTAETVDRLTDRLRLRLTPAGVDGIRKDAQDLHQHPDPHVRNFVDEVLRLLHDHRLLRTEAEAAERHRDWLRGRLELLAKRLRNQEAARAASFAKVTGEIEFMTADPPREARR